MKYRAKKTVVDGIKFDSKKEAKRYQELKRMESEGLITDLQLQPSFILQEAFKDEREGLTKAGKPMTVRKVTYIADFSYRDPNLSDSIIIIEDVKGMKTPVYNLKKKLFLKKFKSYEYDFREI